jgi:hypothetical protein
MYIPPEKIDNTPTTIKLKSNKRQVMELTGMEKCQIGEEIGAAHGGEHGEAHIVIQEIGGVVVVKDDEDDEH